MRRNKKNLITSLVILLVLSIGIVYAYLTSNLSITGTTEIAANSWDIHFDNLNVNPNSVNATTPASIDVTDTTSITYSVLLSRPKQFYEFTVDMVNSGTIPGSISLVSINGIDASAEDLVDYSVNYMYGAPVSVDDVLNAGSSKKIKVRVFYRDDIEIEDLPNSNISMNIVVNITFVQALDNVIDSTNLLQDLAKDNTCIVKYEGLVTDRVGVTNVANNVYFDKCEDKRNIIFGGYCWQIVRTTDTGGMKILYNGEPVNNKCESTRSNQTSIVQNEVVELDEEMNSSYLYGDSFTYDIANNTFTLTNTFTSTWSDSTYENLMKKYTCKSNSATCSTIYLVANRRNSTNAFLHSYSIGSSHYSNIGISEYNYLKNPNLNSWGGSLSNAGYMFNKTPYFFDTTALLEGTVRFSSTYTYNESTNMYTLSGTMLDVDEFNSNYDMISNTHYTCFNTSNTCSTLYYIFYADESDLVDGDVVFGYELNNGRDIGDVLNDAFFADNVNRYNSNIKSLVDAWYANNLRSYSENIEDTIYCNSRRIINYGGFNPNGGLTSIGNYGIGFKAYSWLSDLVCDNITDQFSVSNNKAKLTYPVALLESEEANNVYVTSLLNPNGGNWWLMSPFEVGAGYSSALYIKDGIFEAGAHNMHGVRPVISLKSNAKITEGTGSESNPWIVGVK